MILSKSISTVQSTVNLFRKGSAKDYIIQIGAKNLVEGFDEQVIDMQVGRGADLSALHAKGPS